VTRLNLSHARCLACGRTPVVAAALLTVLDVVPGPVGPCVRAVGEPVLRVYCAAHALRCQRCGTPGATATGDGVIETLCGACRA
jgi:hypothetical protein